MNIDFGRAVKDWVIDHKWYLAAGLVGFAIGGYAFAAPVSEFHQAGESITLHDTTCESIPGTHRAVFLDSKMVATEGCWALQNGMVLIQWSDGDIGRVPQTYFRALRSKSS